MSENKGLFGTLKSKLPDFSDSKTRVRLTLFTGAGILLVVFAMTVAMPFSSNPKLCALACHSMKREYVTWQQSSHKNIPCVACHAKQGLMPFFKEKTIEAPIAVAAELFGHEMPINAESHLGKEGIPRETCERCHDMVTRNVTPSRVFSKRMYGKGEDKYHNKHLKRGIPCTVCHNRVTHKDVNEPEIIKKAGFSESSEYDKKIMGREYINGMSMTEGCFRCHAPSKEARDHELVEKYKAEIAPKTCTTCHNNSILPIGHKGNEWRTIHPQFAKKDFSYCFRCHGPEARFTFEGKAYCTRCHGDDLVKGWLGSVGINTLGGEEHEEKKAE